MNKAIFAALVASTFGLSALSAVAAELTNEERTELRQRAERMQADRAQGLRRVSDVPLDQRSGDVKMKPRGDVKIKPAKSKKIKKSKRSSVKQTKAKLEKIPGALVR